MYKTKVNMDNNVFSKRIEWIDIAKGIAMLCIIAGHLGVDSINRVVFTFHIPIFLLLSGYFIDQKMEFKDYAIKKIKWLIIPYIFTSLCLIIAKIPVDFFKGEEHRILADMLTVFVQAVYGSGSNSNKTIGGIHQIGAIWFLLALLWALLVVKLVIEKRKGYIIIAIIAFISYISSKYVWLPWDVQAGGTASIFVYTGAYLKKLNYHCTQKGWLIILGALILAAEYILGIKKILIYSILHPLVSSFFNAKSLYNSNLHNNTPFML